jgi:hypothetical protein
VSEGGSESGRGGGIEGGSETGSEGERERGREVGSGGGSEGITVADRTRLSGRETVKYSVAGTDTLFELVGM